MIFEQKHSIQKDEATILYRNVFNFPLHMHRSFELYTQKSGKTKIMVDNKEYTLCEGEAILIFPYQLHSYKRVEKGKCTLCIFSPTLVADFYKHNLVPVDNKMLFSLPTNINISNKYLKQALVYHICGTFETDRTYITRVHSSTSEWLVSLFMFINQNYKSSCKLKDAVVTLGYDYSYISKLFKEHVGTSYNQYVNLLRIQDAQTMLLSTSKSVTQIANECGYNNLRSFNRKFIEIVGITPTEYKTNQTKSTILN